MDALLEALAKLLGTFKDPVQVVLLFVVAGLSTFAWKIVRFLMDNNERDINSRVTLAGAMDGLTKMIERTANGKTSGSD